MNEIVRPIYSQIDANIDEVGARDLNDYSRDSKSAFNELEETVISSAKSKRTAAINAVAKMSKKKKF